MKKKTACLNTDYTEGFKITRKNGVFIASNGETTLQAATAEEIQKLIKKASQK